MSFAFRHFQSQTTSAHLAQTMALLTLTSAELRQKIDAELANNPALELLEERTCPTCHRPLPPHGHCPACSRPSSTAADEPIVFISPREDFYTGSSSGSTEDMPEDNTATATEDLPTYVLRQIAPELASEDRGLAAYILTHLNEDGLLTTTPLEVARYHHIPLSRVQNIISVIQHADPVGVGSACPEEALLVQLEILAETREVPPYTREAIEEGLNLLSRHQYQELAHQLKINLTLTKEIAAFISENLNPYPARSHWGDSRDPGNAAMQVFHHPDIIINYLNEQPGNPLVVEIIMPLAGTLRVNPMFRQALRLADENKMDDWKNDLERASLLVKCLQQRNNTMKRLMQRLVVLQRSFIVNGEASLVPLTRAVLSKELEVHESTISRAVAGKAVQLPNKRMIPLSMFFSRNLNIRSVIKDLIERENRPLNDSELVRLLAKQDINIARRTVAKYRAMEGILPAHLRQIPGSSTP